MHVTLKTRIVIADDHAVLREGMRSLLENEKGFEVVGEAAAGSGGYSAGNSNFMTGTAIRGMSITARRKE